MLLVGFQSTQFVHIHVQGFLFRVPLYSGLEMRWSRIGFECDYVVVQLFVLDRVVAQWDFAIQVKDLL